MPGPAFPSVSWLSTGWSVLVSVLGIFSIPSPTTCSKIIFVSTLVALFAPHWAFSWQVQLSTFVTCLTLATLGFVAITVTFSVIVMDLINACCYCSSTIWLMSVEVFHSHFVLLGMLEEGCICDILSLLFWSDQFFDFKVFCCMKQQLCSTYHLLIFTLELSLTISFMHWSGWSVVSCSPCCTSYQCGSSRRLTLLESLEWPWILPQDSFGIPHPLKWAMCSTIWNLPYLGNLQLWQTICFCWCLML